MSILEMAFAFTLANLIRLAIGVPIASLLTWFFFTTFRHFDLIDIVTFDPGRLIVLVLNIVTKLGY
jgi:hypothetical protein